MKAGKYNCMYVCVCVCCTLVVCEARHSSMQNRTPWHWLILPQRQVCWVLHLFSNFAPHVCTYEYVCHVYACLHTYIHTSVSCCHVCMYVCRYAGVPVSRCRSTPISCMSLSQCPAQSFSKNEKLTILQIGSGFKANAIYGTRLLRTWHNTVLEKR